MADQCLKTSPWSDIDLHRGRSCTAPAPIFRSAGKQPLPGMLLYPDSFSGHLLERRAQRATRASASEHGEMRNVKPDFGNERLRFTTTSRLSVPRL
jgi:hypothetical protein